MVVYAEDLAYWKTSQTNPDTWLDKAKVEIRRAGGKVLGEMSGTDHTGRSAYMLMFQFGEDRFKLIWPVVQSKTGNLKAAKIQAATSLYHAIKARADEVRRRGARAAFYGDLMLPDGRTAAEATGEEFLRLAPGGFLPAPRAIESGDIIEG